MKSAIIFAAGSGTRLNLKTTHKSLIKFNGLTLIEHIIIFLLEVPSIDKIVVITGYMSEKFNFLTEKYQKVSLVFNEYFEKYNTAYALVLIKEEFTLNRDLFLISGDFVMQKNCFKEKISKNLMAAMKRINNNPEWCYKFDMKKNIIDIYKSENINDLLASEWTHINKSWAKKLSFDLDKKSEQERAKSEMFGKYLINNAIFNKIPLKPYIIDNKYFWDLDTEDDLNRLKKFLD